MTDLDEHAAFARRLGLVRYRDVRYQRGRRLSVLLIPLAVACVRDQSARQHTSTIGSATSVALPSAEIAGSELAASPDTSSGGACLPAGNFTCAFALNGNAMGYDCTGTGQIQYRK